MLDYSASLFFVLQGISKKTKKYRSMDTIMTKYSAGTPVGETTPQFKFFLNMKSNPGIAWKENKDFKNENIVSSGKLSMVMNKDIYGSIKRSVASSKPDYIVRIRCEYVVNPDQSISNKNAIISLKQYGTNAEIKKWFVDTSEKSGENNAISFLQNIIGLHGFNAELPTEYIKRTSDENFQMAPVDIHGRPGYYYNRLTRTPSNAYGASEAEIFIRKTISGTAVVWATVFSVHYFESEEAYAEKLIKTSKSLIEAKELADKSLQVMRGQRGYVGPESTLYIPEGVNKDNWDFLLHKWTDPAAQSIQVPQQIPLDPSQVSQDPTVAPSSTDPSDDIAKDQIFPEGPPESKSTESTESTEPKEIPLPRPKFKKPTFDFRKLVGQTQDFGGYYNGDVPDWAGGLIGTPSVDASQIGGMFGGTNEAIQLVNSYTSDALNNVAYIFNFSKSGAYGVYIPSLDRAIKTKTLKKQLEQKGYQIKDVNGLLTAYPTKEKKTQEQIDQDIDGLWQQLNSGGGSALGINMADVLNATDQNVSSIMSKMKSQNPENSEIPSQFQSILHDVLGVYHLAAIILHEASHAKGGDEAKAEFDESSFRQWAQKGLNEQFKSKLSSSGMEELYGPLEISGEVLHAKSKDWYKYSQSFFGRLNYHPSGGTPSPQGSDLRGRYNGAWQTEGFADWAKLVMQDQSTPIEKRLNNSTMSKLEKDVNQEDDIIEEQLRKQFRNDSKPNVQLLTEELLAPDRDESQGYKAMETLLDERRPQPLMTPLQKAAMKKESRKENSSFGWYNNLDLDDGSTIPGLSDRVMAWDDRDESFSQEEQCIKSQERYNPSYDLKGFYFRWIEPRFKPELFEDMSRDYTNTTPAKRFAAVLDPSLTQMLSVLKLIEEEIINEKIKATRIVVTDDLIDIIKKLTNKEGLNIRPYKIADSDDMFAIWVYGSNIGVNSDSFDKAENYFQNVDGSGQYKDIAEDLLQGKSIVTKAVEKVVNSVRGLCKKYDVNDLFLVGEYARKIFQGEYDPFVGELNFICESVDAGLKIGSILANQLNVSDKFFHMSNTGLSFPYKGIRIFFSKGSYFHDITDKMTENGHDFNSPLLREICNRNFTINMMAYDVREMSILDPIGVKSDVKNKIVKTLFDPEFIINKNPMIILCAMGLKLSGYELDEDLERSIIENSHLLKSGRYSPERLMFSREYLKSMGENVDELFNEYGLTFEKEE